MALKKLRPGQLICPGGIRWEHDGVYVGSKRVYEGTDPTKNREVMFILLHVLNHLDEIVRLDLSKVTVEDLTELTRSS